MVLFTKKNSACNKRKSRDCCVCGFVLLTAMGDLALCCLFLVGFVMEFVKVFLTLWEFVNILYLKL